MTTTFPTKAIPVNGTELHYLEQDQRASSEEEHDYRQI